MSAHPVTNDEFDRSTDATKRRQQQILEWAKEEKQLTVEMIAQRFNVTPQTIRRNINQLCEMGLLRRHYGGVSLPNAQPETPTPSEPVLSLLAKQLAETIPEQASVSLGSGANMILVAKALLHHQDLKVLTNNLSVASALAENPNIEVIVSGGQYRHTENDLVGPEVTAFFSSFHTDYGVIQADGLDPELGLMDSDIREAEAHRAVISNTRTALLLADHSRWDTRAACKIASFNYVNHFYTDKIAPTIRNQLPEALTLVEAER